MRSFAADPTPPAADPLGDLLDEFLRHHPDGDVDVLRRSYLAAEAAHRGQRRKTGEPYITHPIAVAEILARYGMEAPVLAAALLHDTLEDTDLTYDEVSRDFGVEVAALIDGVTKLDRIQYGSREEAQAATIRKMVVAMAQDLRVLVIKLCDRLHNIRTITPLSPQKRERVARETLDIYAPLAHRLGMQEIKHELEDRCFEVLYPGRYAEIESKLADRAPERDVFIEKMVAEVGGMLADAGIQAEVTGRPKHHYSIYRKMVETGRPFEDIHDLIGLRVIVDEVRDCYAALGLVHARWVPVTGRFKDYVAMPKFNLYQSLHTTVIGPDGKPLEVQIRTAEMHRVAESGIAAHWRYKEGPEAHGLAWVRDLPALEEAPNDPIEFLDDLKLDLYQDEVFVLTPKGDVKTLPRDATPIDFAYAVHTEVGNRCVGAKVNGRLVPLSTRLQSGDIIDIITSRSLDAGPSRDWLSFARTSRAKSKIKQWFLKERRASAIAEGRDLVLAHLRKEGLGLGANERDSLLGEVASGFHKTDLEGLYQAVGENEISAATVISRLARLVHPDAEEPSGVFVPPIRRRSTGVDSLVIVEGLDDMLVRIARCCAPVPGDDIAGYVTVGRGVSVHRSDCTNIAGLSSEGGERMVEVSWRPDQVGVFSIWIQVEALDRTRLLRDVTAAISELGGNITASSSYTGADRVAVLRYEVELSDPGQVPRLIADLRGVDGVFAAFRLTTEPSP